MTSTTSRTIKRSRSKTRASRLVLTVPSIEFSMARKPRSVRPSSTAATTSGKLRNGTASQPPNSGSERSASSENVPSGPRNPMVGR